MSSNVLIIRRDTAEVIRRRHPIESIVLENMIRRGEARIIDEESSMENTTISFSCNQAQQLARRGLPLHHIYQRRVRPHDKGTETY